MVYNKLVRDRIPEIIEAQGDRAVARILEKWEYTQCLEAKLDEEVAEYHRDKNVEELADIMEVLLALAELHGASEEELKAVCDRKRQARGGFSKRIFLISKEERK